MVSGKRLKVMTHPELVRKLKRATYSAPFLVFIYPAILFFIYPPAFAWYLGFWLVACVLGLMVLIIGLAYFAVTDWWESL